MGQIPSIPPSTHFLPRAPSRICSPDSRRRPTRDAAADSSPRRLAASTPAISSGILDFSPVPAAWVLVGVDELPPSWDPIVTPKFGKLWQARWPSHQFSGE
ncbi:hypothetical protein VPH35_059300 [Triticum aestivum]